MQQSYKSVTDKYRKELKAQDFVLLSQQNKQYRNLFKIMTEKQAFLTQQVIDLEKKANRLQNEKQEYKMRSNEYAAKMNQYEIIREQLNRQYKALKREIDEKINKNNNKDKEFENILYRLETMSEENLQLQQQCKRKDLIIDDLNERLRKLQAQVMDKKLKIFSQVVDNNLLIPLPASRVNSKNKEKNRNKKQLSFIQNSKTQSNSRSLGTSDINSISFSLIETDSISNSKASKGSRTAHNKAIYL